MRARKMCELAAVGFLMCLAGACARHHSHVHAQRLSVDDAIRPDASRETARVPPCGEILIAPGSRAGNSPLLDAIRARGLRLSSSRCGDFRQALDLLGRDTELRRLGERLITHRIPASELARAFELASSPASIKIVVEHDGVGLSWATGPSPSRTGP